MLAFSSGNFKSIFCLCPLLPFFPFRLLCGIINRVWLIEGTFVNKYVKNDIYGKPRYQIRKAILIVDFHMSGHLNFSLNFKFDKDLVSSGEGGRPSMSEN